MRKFVVILLFAVLLSGCGVSETFETVSDELLQPVMEQTGEIVLTVPDGASTPVMTAEDGGKLYLCDGYTLTVQTMAAGDLNRTVKTLCGYELDALTVLQTRDGGWNRHEWIWVSAGEGGEQLGRAAVLEDGKHHYCITVMADAVDAPALEPEWDGIFASFAVT